MQIDDGRWRREKSRGRLSAAEVLKRYKDDDLPAFAEMQLTHVNQVGIFGERQLDIAAGRGDLEEIYALLDAGAHINAPGEHGYTALHQAVSQGHVDAVMFFLSSVLARTSGTNLGTRRPLSPARESVTKSWPCLDPRDRRILTEC